MPELEPFRIVVGRDYVYLKDWPKGCKGHTYRALAFIQQFPTYQEQVLVQAMTGPDTGLLFCCSLGNFANRYEPKE